MSTYWYLQVAQQMWVTRENLIQTELMIAATGGDLSFARPFHRNAWAFIRKHSGCRVQLVNEYGDVRSIDAVFDQSHPVT